MLAAVMVLGGCGQGKATSTTAKNTHTDAAVVRLNQAVGKLFSNDQHNLPADKLTDKQIQAAHTLYNKAVARGSKLTNADVKLVNRADRDISKAKQFFAVTSGLKDALGDSQVIVPDYNADNLVAAWGDVSSYSVFVTKYGDQMKLVNQEVAAVKLVQKLYDGTLGDVTNSNGTESKNYSVKSNVTADAIAAAKKAVNAVKVDAFKTRYMKYVDAARIRLMPRLIVAVQPPQVVAPTPLMRRVAVPTTMPMPRVVVGLPVILVAVALVILDTVPGTTLVTALAMALAVVVAVVIPDLVTVVLKDRRARMAVIRPVRRAVPTAVVLVVVANLTLPAMELAAPVLVRIHSILVTGVAAFR